jgi:peptide-methionine (S)-S-oxide reductase
MLSYILAGKGGLRGGLSQDPILLIAQLLLPLIIRLCDFIHISIIIVIMNLETAVFGGGCFWCTEAVFKMLKGVHAVMPGYAGGTAENPTYGSVSAGASGHAEVIKMEFDPTVIKYRDLLTVFFASHDPSTPNRQGNDVGTQYRSIILTTSEDQRIEAEKYIAEIKTDNPTLHIVTEIKPLEQFFLAEDYHQDYYASHQSAPYCQLVIEPKLKKVSDKFSELLTDQKKL